MIEIFIAPIIMLIIYVYIRDKYEKEPYKMVLTSIIIGAILSPAIIKTEQLLMDKLHVLKITSSFAEVTIISFLVAALVEEGIKFIFLYAFAMKNKEVNEPFDGIVYSSYIALGFAQIENLMYYMSVRAAGDGALIYRLGLNRGLTAIVAHLIYGVIMGYYMGRFKFERSGKLKNLTLSLAIPLLVHGLYDLIVLSYQYKLASSVLGAYLLLTCGVIVSLKMMKKALKRSPFRKIKRRRMKKARKNMV